MLDTDATSLDFGTIPFDSQTTRLLTLSNSGNRFLQGTASTEFPFIVAFGDSYTIREGLRRSLSVVFAPTEEGTWTGELLLKGEGEVIFPEVIISLVGSAVPPEGEGEFTFDGVGEATGEGTTEGTGEGIGDGGGGGGTAPPAGGGCAATATAKASTQGRLGDLVLLFLAVLMPQAISTLSRRQRGRQGQAG